MSTSSLRTARGFACLGLALLAGCGGPVKPEPETLSPEQARALIDRLLPARIPDRNGWVTDIHAAFTAIDITTTAEHVCAVAAVAEQESGFESNPAIPGLPAIAMKEIDQRAEHAGIPALVVHAALHLPSPSGRSYSERIEAARTERDLSDIFEDLVGVVPLGRMFLADRNPIRTAGPMQVSVSYAEAYADTHAYPYPVGRSLRREVFTRRGSVYFGVAHLLDYAAAYDQPLYRFADYNAGQYASRNAAFQHALSLASGIPLADDGELVRLGGGDPPTSTELAARVLRQRIDLSEADIHDDLQHSRRADFEQTELYEKVYALAERSQAHPLPRAQVPRIELKSPKITRHLTTAWYASRVDGRFQGCMQRARANGAMP
ncbi:DUF1615 domain-containing protein [Nevskia soli]|uniref:DUF1615 domain-containing protein n=1 Tax=Nevskia soli TaxID=418856 RepID=UPI000A84931A|nr:DUF1615 domain-containing protein [Nevskia soli]